MENASKALLIAGGVLLAILIISVALYILGSARGLASSMNEKAELSAIESFNRYYESFGSQIMGIDVVNIANKVENDIANGHLVTKDYQQSLVTNLSNKLSDNNTNIADMTTNQYSYSISYDSDGYVNKVSIK